MNEIGLQPGGQHVKGAQLVGEVMRKYHPHGDSPSYDTLVRLAQDFSLRYPLVDGHGNFGNIDGYSAAAMRYTEARLDRLAVEMLRDIDQETVDFVPTYDGAKQEPVVLPSRFPNLLVNGGSGIAVGMATNIPPHNLREVIKATIAYIDDPAIDVEGLMKHIKGPDFPTAGTILGRDGIREAYKTGRGRIRVQAKAHVEPIGQGKEAIIVTELPYQVRKGGDGGLIMKIRDLVLEKKLPEVTDLRDESDRHGMRIVIELKREGQPKQVLNALYKHTAVQSSFTVHMLCLVGGQPKTVNLATALKQHIAFRRDVIRRRSEFDLAKTREREHIVSGLLRAIDKLDKIGPDGVREELLKSQVAPDAAERILEMVLLRGSAGDVLEDLSGRLDGDERAQAALENLRALFEETLAKAGFLLTLDQRSSEEGAVFRISPQRGSGSARGDDNGT